MLTSQIALKEWAVVVEALGCGEQLILLRKGGLRDPKGAFQLQHREFLLFPTWEHQKEGCERNIRPDMRQKYHDILSPPAPASVRLCIYGGVAHVAEIRDPEQLKGLEKYHIWTPDFFIDRMRYRPQAATVVVVLRVFKLPVAVLHPVKPEYLGCKSWVPLASEISIEGSQPVVENQRFRSALEEISSRLG